MEFPQIVSDLVKHQTFLDWSKKHPHHFLAHIFVTIVQDAAQDYQVGYYDLDSGQITSFAVSGSDVNELPPSEVLKDPDNPIKALDVEGIEFSTEDVLAKAHQVREEEYDDLGVVKVFLIIQHLGDLGNVFNVTFITPDLKTLNIKLSTSSGEVISHSLASLIHQDK